jgi:hypothetical protein
VIRRREALAGIGQLGGDRHAGRVVERVVERAYRQVRHPQVVHAVGLIPADERGEVGSRARPQRLVARVARLPPGDRILQVDEPEEDQVIAQPRPRLGVAGEAEEEAVGALDVAAHGGDRVGVQPVVERAGLDDRPLLALPHHRPVGRRRHLHALHRRVAAGVAAEELVPDVEPGRDVPDGLEERQQATALRHVGRQAHGGPEAEDGVVVVDQRDLAVADVDVARHLHERCLGRRHHGQGIAEGTILAPHHSVEELGGARLVTREDGVRQQRTGFLERRHHGSPMPGRARSPR